VSIKYIISMSCYPGCTRLHRDDAGTLPELHHPRRKKGGLFITLVLCHSACILFVLITTYPLDKFSDGKPRYLTY